MTTDGLGWPKARSPRPSATNTITFCSPLFASATNSWLKIGTLCCLAHCGSACMLMIVALGNFPSNLTTPVSVARSTVLLASLGGFPSLIAGSQIATKRQPRIKVLVVMHSNSPPHETGTSLLGIPEPAGSCREYEERRVTLSITGNCLVICLSAPGVTRDDIFLTFRRLVTMLLLSRPVVTRRTDAGGHLQAAPGLNHTGRWA